jgi:hypothetical protein
MLLLTYAELEAEMAIAISARVEFGAVGEGANIVNCGNHTKPQAKGL